MVAVFLRPLANSIKLTSLVYSGLTGVGKFVYKCEYQVVDRPNTLQNVLEIMSSKRRLLSKDRFRQG